MVSSLEVLGKSEEENLPFIKVNQNVAQGLAALVVGEMSFLELGQQAVDRGKETLELEAGSLDELGFGGGTRHRNPLASS